MTRLLPVLTLVLLFAAGWWSDLAQVTAAVLGLDDSTTAEPPPPPTSDSGASWDPWGG